MELINAQWKIGEGRTVDLRLEGNGFDRVHPFKKFQKKRAGRVGTRFVMSCATQDGQVIFKGEVMFAGWSDTSSKGQIVKFWLDDEATAHPFAGFSYRREGNIGAIFGVVLVEIGDDDKPIDQVAEQKIAGVQKKGRTFSSSAHLMITGEKFVQYLRETQKFRPGLELNGEVAKRWVKHQLKIEHLSDLDRDPAKLRLFRELVQRPFARWNGEDV